MVPSSATSRSSAGTLPQATTTRRASSRARFASPGLVLLWQLGRASAVLALARPFPLPSQSRCQKRQGARAPHVSGAQVPLPSTSSSQADPLLQLRRKCDAAGKRGVHHGPSPSPSRCDVGIIVPVLVALRAAGRGRSVRASMNLRVLAGQSVTPDAVVCAPACRRPRSWAARSRSSIALAHRARRPVRALPHAHAIHHRGGRSLRFSTTHASQSWEAPPESCARATRHDRGEGGAGAARADWHPRGSRPAPIALATRPASSTRRPSTRDARPDRRRRRRPEPPAACHDAAANAPERDSEPCRPPSSGRIVPTPPTPLPPAPCPPARHDIAAHAVPSPSLVPTPTTRTPPRGSPHGSTSSGRAYTAVASLRQHGARQCCYTPRQRGDPRRTSVRGRRSAPPPAHDPPSSQPSSQPRYLARQRPRRARRRPAICPHPARAIPPHPPTHPAATPAASRRPRGCATSRTYSPRDSPSTRLCTPHPSQLAEMASATSSRPLPSSLPPRSPSPAPAPAHTQSHSARASQP
ncbi:hypothetical protein BC628DRAFT_735464 [Trametes gibbosa]|nr:hypothetical protein BC628DRAFT_735464 [Trametes gibbosa]